MLHLVRADSAITDNVEMRVLGHIFGGYIGSFTVDNQVSALLQCPFK